MYKFKQVIIGNNIVNHTPFALVFTHIHVIHFIRVTFHNRRKGKKGDRNFMCVVSSILDYYLRILARVEGGVGNPTYPYICNFHNYLYWFNIWTYIR